MTEEQIKEVMRQVGGVAMAYSLFAAEKAADLTLAAEARHALEAYLRTIGAEPTFQQRVQPWMLACFGAEIAADKVERNHRFLEEALELVQATGCTAGEAHQLVDYVYGRPVGDPPQEVGGVKVTLAALCLAHGIDMHSAAETELARIWTKVEQIRAKQAAKPKHSPLPEMVVMVPSVSAELLSALKASVKSMAGYRREMHRGRSQPCDAERFAAEVIARAESAIEGSHKHLEPWQPIETAPHDEVLLLACEFDGPGDWRIKCGYFDDDLGGWKVWGASWVPTRWATIPAPPNLSDAARRDQTPAKVSPCAGHAAQQDADDLVGLRGCTAATYAGRDAYKCHFGTALGGDAGTIDEAKANRQALRAIAKATETKQPKGE